MAHLTRGVLLALEGIDGSGKSTLAHALATLFRENELSVILTKEPGGTKLGKQLRAALQEQTIPLCAKAEYLLFAADRAQHMHELIEPSLSNNMMVISDRMGDSACAYQGYGRELDPHMIHSINTWAMNSIQPDLTIYVRVNLETSLERITTRNEKRTSFEQETKDFFQRVIDGYEAMYNNRDDVIILDGTQTKEQLQQSALDKVMSWLTNNHILHH